MNALTVRQPWAWAIIHAGKDVENRRWAPPAKFVGTRIAIHSSQQSDGYARLPVEVERTGPYVRGAILGTVLLAGYRHASSSPWAEPGQVHWLLEDPIPIDKPIECRGQLGLWSVPEDVLGRLS